MENEKFLYDYMNAYSPVGQEGEGQAVWTKFMSKLGQIEKSAYGNACAIIKGDTPGRDQNYKVMIEAHCDEIAWKVSNIQDDGLIKVVRNGGSDAMIAPSKKVFIYTENGKVEGAFGFPAIHTRPNGSDKALKPADLFIDIGFDKKEDVIAAGVEVGNNVTFKEEFGELGDYYVGKALDNKIGGFVIASVAKRLKDNNITLPFDLLVHNSITEEIGLYGAKQAAIKYSPDCALVIDVCHITNAGINKGIEGDIKGGSGYVLETSAQNHRVLTNLFKNTSKQKNIPFQLNTGSFGNDTMSFYEMGIPTMIASIGLKYMHTTVEMVHKQDVQHLIDAFYNALLELKIEDIHYN